MSTTIPENVRDLLDGPNVVVLATVMPDGTPQLTPVWASYDGEHILLTTIRGRRKEKNVQERPQVTVLVIDPADPYRWLEVRGVVAEMTEEGAIAHIDAMTRLYEGVDTFYGGYVAAERGKTETRILLKIKPTRVNANG